jgi:membrane protein
VVRQARVNNRWLDHLFRTVQRYNVQSGDQLAGGCTYFAFLSFFPLIALAFAVFGYIVTFRPNALKTLIQAINEQLPGLAGRLGIEQLADVRLQAGIIGVLGLLYAGLGAVNALRDALNTIWMDNQQSLNFFRAKLRDLVALVFMGFTMVASVVVSGFATRATTTVARWLGLGDSFLAAGSVWATGLLASVAADTFVFLIILGWIARPPEPFPIVFRGALLGAISFGLLKQLATLVLSGTLENPIYGTFAVIAGLLIWLNLSFRVILYAAAWTATATLGPPPEPTPMPSIAY